MSTTSRVRKNPKSGLLRVRGKYRPVYKRASFTNVQGEREEVLLFDTQNESMEETALAVDSHPELRLDLRRALSQFNRQERRVLFRRLVQRQSMTVATQNMKKRSASWWRKWYKDVALPKLRESLKDYWDGKEVVA